MRAIWHMLCCDDLDMLTLAELAIRQRYHRIIPHVVARLRQLADRLAGDQHITEADQLIEQYRPKVKQQ